MASPHRHLLLPLSRLLPLLIAAAAFASLLAILLLIPPRPPPPHPDPDAHPPTSPSHLLFGIASTSRLWDRRKRFLRRWWRPGATRGLVFLDDLPPSAANRSDRLPPLRVSADASRFPYTFRRGLPSAVRVARVAKELVDLAAAGEAGLSLSDVRWVVFADDDTVFVVENLAATLDAYDWTDWWYVGGRSESALQNAFCSFQMAFGGGGIALSLPLAKALAAVLDSCLMRYPHLYGSDVRIFACLAELGVELSHEPGFHQVDVRGDISGLLRAHPLKPLVSLHHVDSVDPIFPGMDQSMAMERFFNAANADPARILQQTICFKSSLEPPPLTISISWGYSIQVFEGEKQVTDLLPVQRTFRSWRRGRNATDVYMFDTNTYPRDPCKQPAVFYQDGVSSSHDGKKIESNYTRHLLPNCLRRGKSFSNLQQIKVTSKRLTLVQRKALRRHCCDILPSSETVMNIDIRRCRDDELIAMNPLT